MKLLKISSHFYGPLKWSSLGLLFIPIYSFAAYEYKIFVGEIAVNLMEILFQDLSSIVYGMFCWCIILSFEIEFVT